MLKPHCKPMPGYNRAHARAYAHKHTRGQVQHNT